MKNSKTIVFVSCFNAYTNRIKYIIKRFEEDGYDFIYLTSNFSHSNKKYYKINYEKGKQLKVLAYKKNFSLRRLLSHFLFSRKVYKNIKKQNPDILYVMLPPNALAYYSARFKKKFGTILIFDIYDLWPETFPIKGLKNVLKIPFYFWKSLRDRNLTKADIVVTECDLFKNKLMKSIRSVKQITLYPLILRNEGRPSDVILMENELNLCYLGSINNIIDISGIANILAKVNTTRKIIIHIIGDGEKRQQFIALLKEKKITVVFYGKVYDEKIKQQVFDKCAFGINMMKDTVVVGLTLKSIDYISAGLPLLNNITGDTSDLVDKYAIGINIEKDIDKTVQYLTSISIETILGLRENTQHCYMERFSEMHFNSKITEIMNYINKII